MKLAKRLQGHFSTSVRNRGEAYFWQNRVRMRRGTTHAVEAVVRGSGNYEVSLAWENGVLTPWCDCPYFCDSGVLCKHLWATILAADAQKHLSDVAAAPSIVVDGGTDMAEEDRAAAPDRAIFASKIARPAAPKPPQWREMLTGIVNQRALMSNSRDAWPAKREILYIVDVAGSLRSSNLALWLYSRDRKGDGSYTRPRPLTLQLALIPRLPLAGDRELLAALSGAKPQYWGGGMYEQLPLPCVVPHPLAITVVPLAIRTGRCYLQTQAGTEEWAPLIWDDGGTWQFGLEIWRREHEWIVAGALSRGEERMDVTSPVLITPGGLVFNANRVSPLAADTGFDWVSNLRKQEIKAPEKDGEDLVAALLCSPNSPPLSVPEELRFEELRFPPRPRLQIRAADPFRSGIARLRAHLSFDYDGRVVAATEEATGFYDPDRHRFVRRDFPAEQAATALLAELGLKYQNQPYRGPYLVREEPTWELAPTKLPRTVRALVEAGWHIEAEGKILRRPGKFHIEVSSGVDWFELHGGVDYGETTAQLPELLETLRRGDNVVRLDDGTYGLLPEQWLHRIGLVAGMGSPEDGHLRFRRSQAGLLDALLSAQPEAHCDETFTRVRGELQRFQGVEHADQPAGFVGQLRHYQREGLGWMRFLQRFSLGGCLADDMGVGKTAQVLALLETRRELRTTGEPVAPSLVVVPKSLVFNWKQEAERFTPQLRALDHTGLGRNSSRFADYDLVLTTYGTLRRDILRLKEVNFDYVVLDEAQTIKNAGTESARAVRLLRSGYRLALSGTPIENHLGELWSLFEFLNPGMLGAASVFKLAGTSRDPDQETRALLSRALRPFILRRTKEQVAPELPSKTEQTIYCELESAQRKLYNQLRQHYRDSLLRQIEMQGLAKSKIQVLEALLRLRQAACHPGLLDPKRGGDSSAKLEVLLAQLCEILDAGHKALVFSQFTSLLKLVRNRLDKLGVEYEYLDGATDDRQARVERFQNDTKCHLFLISLKAGGLGLNLTAAGYVFLLDPWWNPAVEMQAVDRAHRIGQTRPVFAYRLIARDTVEEKVLELQKTKRNLAEAIIGTDNSMIRDLRPEDLELLLS